MTPEQFWSRVEPEPNSGCWIWMGTHSRRHGYGQVRTSSRQNAPGLAHRAAYVLAVGPIPKGMQLDHLCRLRCCVNPAHLEVVTRRENILRGTSPSAENAVKTACPRGHAYDAIQKTRRGCRTCDNARFKTIRERRKTSATHAEGVLRDASREPDDGGALGASSHEEEG